MLSIDLEREALKQSQSVLLNGSKQQNSFLPLYKLWALSYTFKAI